LRFAISEPLERFLTLVESESRGASEFHTTSLCTLSAVIGAGQDHASLEFGQGTKHGAASAA
jgi:hypothetical protein